MVTGWAPGATSAHIPLFQVQGCLFFTGTLVCIYLKKSNIHKLRWKSCYVLTHSSSGFSNTNCHRQTTIKLYEVKVFPLAANTGINSTHNTLQAKEGNCYVIYRSGALEMYRVYSRIQYWYRSQCECVSRNNCTSVLGCITKHQCI